MNIFVGNLSFEAKEADVYKFFLPFGSVTYVSIVMDKKGKNSRGFGFLEMPDEVQAKAAIAALEGKEFMRRPIHVEPALTKRPKKVFSPRNKRERSIPDEHKDIDLNRSGIRMGSGYKAGRRSLSFMKRRLAAGITEPLSERKNQKNPMRWRKKKPWEKSQGEARRV